MKVYVYKNKDNNVCGHLMLVFQNKEKYDSVSHYELMGTTEIDIQPPKKTVRKEIELLDGFYRITWTSPSGGSSATLPMSAKNIKITYEVDE